jgi:predicted DNA-binding transcriptional regulator YafY
MLRSTKAERTLRLNAAFDLRVKGHARGESAALLAARYGLSRRQAYRYLQEAQAIKSPMPVGIATIPVTVRIPEDVASRLRAFAQQRGLTIGAVVAQAVLNLLPEEHRSG